MGKGRRQAFGDSPEEILLKQRLGTFEYERRKKMQQAEIKPRMFTREFPGDWGKGEITYFGEGYTINPEVLKQIEEIKQIQWGKPRQMGWGVNQMVEYKKMIEQFKEGNDEPKKDPIEEWADEWARQQGMG